MALQFPASPVQNQTYTYNGLTWQWNGAAWDNISAVSSTAYGHNFTFAAVPPSNPNIGDEWLDSNSGSVYTWMSDPNGFQWMEINPAGFAGTQGIQGIQGASFQGIQGLQGQAIQGVQGLQGFQGLQGIQGFFGLQGVQGPNAAIAFGATPPANPNIGDRWVDANSGSEYTWISYSGVTAWVEVSASGYSGVQGIQGIQGQSIQGVQGIQGNPGIQGFGYAQLQGTQGLQGFTGTQGTYYISQTAPLGVSAGNAWLNTTDGSLYIFDGNEWFEPYGNYLGVQGLQGFQGPSGISGSNGFQGVQGLVGPAGVQGATGPGVLAINSQYGSTYTAILNDGNAFITMSNAGANTFLIPTGNSVGYPIGTSLTVMQVGSGQTTIQAASIGVTTILSNASTPSSPKLRTAFSSATLIKAGSDLWYVAGDIS